MEKRSLGQSGLELSVLGFGCGMVGGLMIKGSAAEQACAVARALELGVNYFDTAPLYGEGMSERNLGPALKSAGAGSALVGTKTWVKPPEEGNLEQGITRYIDDSIETSLRLLGRDRVDLFQLHNVLGLRREGIVLDPATVLDIVFPVFERLQRQGKVRAFGITGLGDTQAMRAIVESGSADQLTSVQVVYNLLNDSAGRVMPASYPAQDYEQLLLRLRERGMAALGIRCVAGGALSGTAERHPMGLASVPPLGSGADYAADVRRAQRLQPLVDEGHVGSLIEAAVRFCTGNPLITSTMVGLSSMEQLEEAAQAAKKGALPAEALARIAELQAGFVGESR